MKTIISDRISIDAGVCHGKPVVTGTRVLVANVVGALAAGQTIASVLEDYPSLQEEDIRACLQYAAAQAGNSVVRLQPA